MSEVSEAIIIDKLKEYGMFITDVDLAKFLGITKQRICAWRKGNYVNVDLVSQKFPDVSKRWLYTGKGEMLKENDDEYMSKVEVDENGKETVKNKVKEDPLVPRIIYNSVLEKCNKLEDENKKLKEELYELRKKHEKMTDNYIALLSGNRNDSNNA